MNRSLSRFWHKCHADDCADDPPICTVYRDPKGTITSDGHVYQVWRQISPTHVVRVGKVLFRTLHDAKQALESAE